MKYISILRGINVSGHNKIKMADLKALYESLGFINVVTYIQSGNVIFDSGEADQNLLKKHIEQGINSSYGFQVPVFIITGDYLSYIINNNPFSPVDLEKDGTRILVTFLSEIVPVDLLGQLEKFRASTESLEPGERHIYLHCPDGYGRTKLSNNLIEKKLGVQATTRNWKTVVKLNELSNDLQGEP